MDSDKARVEVLLSETLKPGDARQLDIQHTVERSVRIGSIWGNAPRPGVIMISALLVGERNVMPQGSTSDAFVFTAEGRGPKFDVKAFEGERIRLLGHYTGLHVPEFKFEIKGEVEDLPFHEGVLIERFAFSLNEPLVIGEAKDFLLKDWIARAIEAKTLQANAPCSEFVMLDDVQIDGIDAIYDESKHMEAGPIDGYDFDAVGMSGPAGFKIKDPIVCDHGVRARARYTGRVPSGMKKSDQFLFCLTVMGPSIRT